MTPAAEPSAALPHEASLTLAIIVLHLVFSIFHGAAHMHYEIPLAEWQKVYIAVVIFVAPLGAGGLLLGRWLRAGAWVMLVAMAGSLLFGLDFHFLLLGPDHVSSVDFHPWGVLFQVTAFFLAVTEAWGASVAFRLLRVAARPNSQGGSALV